MLTNYKEVKIPKTWKPQKHRVAYAPPSLFLSLFLFLHWSILPSFLSKAHLGGEAPSSMAYSIVDGTSSHLFSFVFRCISMVENHHWRTSLKLKEARIFTKFGKTRWAFHSSWCILMYKSINNSSLDSFSQLRLDIENW